MCIYKHWLVVDLVTKLCPTLGTPWTVPVKLLCLLDFLGKSTGVGCNFLLQCIHTHTHTHTHTHIYKCVLIYVCYICMITYTYIYSVIIYMYNEINSRLIYINFH